LTSRFSGVSCAPTEARASALKFSKEPIMLPAIHANTKPSLPVGSADGAWAYGCRFDRHEGDLIG